MGLYFRLLPDDANVHGEDTVAFLRELRRRLPVPMTILWDRGNVHDRSKAVRAYLAEWGQRVKVHYLPKYSPDTNPIERVWWRLQEAVTRNHRCHTMDELLDLTFDWFATGTHFRVRSEVYAESL